MPDNQASASAATPAAPAHSRGQTGGLIMPGAAQMAGAARPKSAQVNHEWQKNCDLHGDGVYKEVYC